MAQTGTSSHWRFWPTRRTTEPEIDPEDAALEAASPVGQRLEIVCCGAFAARYDGRDIVFTRSRKARELLAFLATRHGMSASCDETISALWPEAEPDRARRLLINAAWRARCALRTCCVEDGNVWEAVLRFTHDHYTLDARLCACDLARYRAEQAHTEAYLRPYSATTNNTRHATNEAQHLLDLDRTVEAPVLAGEAYTWLPALERQIRELRLSSLRQALRLASHGETQELALTIAERILTLDALNEPTVALTMRLHLVRGDSASAASTYRAFRLALARRYGSAASALAQPSQELQTLFAQAVGKDSAAREPVSTAQAGLS